MEMMTREQAITVLAKRGASAATISRVASGEMLVGANPTDRENVYDLHVEALIAADALDGGVCGICGVDYTLVQRMGIPSPLGVIAIMNGENPDEFVIARHCVTCMATVIAPVLLKHGVVDEDGSKGDNVGVNDPADLISDLNAALSTAKDRAVSRQQMLDKYKESCDASTD